MLVDWLTVAAQAINFIVLVWLLQRFLYRPIVRAMRQRKERVEQQTAAARRAEAEAAAARERYERLRTELAAAREAELARARAAAEQYAAERREQARREVEATQHAWMESLAREQERFWQEFEDRVAREVLDTAEQVLADLAGASLDEQIRLRFLEQLDAAGLAAAADLAPADRGPIGLAAALKDGGGAGCAGEGPEAAQVQVLSAQELPKDYREQVLSVVRRLAGKEDLAVGFARRPELLAGVELRGSGWKTGWSLRGYMDAMRGQIDFHITGATSAGAARSGDSAAPATIAAPAPVGEAPAVER